MGRVNKLLSGHRELPSRFAFGTSWLAAASLAIAFGAGAKMASGAGLGTAVRASSTGLFGVATERPRPAGRVCNRTTGPGELALAGKRGKPAAAGSTATDVGGAAGTAKLGISTATAGTTALASAGKA